MKENLKVVIETFIIGLLLLCNRVILGANRFISSPEDPTYVKLGSEARFTWEYEVNVADLKVIAWSALDPPSLTVLPGVSAKDLVIEENQQIKIAPGISGRYSGRVSVEKLVGKPGTNKRTLVISNITKEDENRYFQALELQLAEVRTGANLLVSDLKIVEHPVNAFTTKGGEATFAVNATGPPTPNITWYRYGEKLKPSSVVKIEDDGSGHSKLTIKNCTLKDVGYYTAEVTNPPDLRRLVKAALAIPYVDLDKFKSTGTVEAKIGDTVTLVCDFTGIPPPRVNWTHPSGTWEYSGCILLVDLRRNEDFGNYTCSSLDGSLTHTMSVNEIGKVEDEPGHIPKNHRSFLLDWKNKTVEGAVYAVCARKAGSNTTLEPIGSGGPNTTNFTITSNQDFPEEYFETSKTVKTEFVVFAVTGNGSLGCKPVFKQTEYMVAKARSLQAGLVAAVVPLVAALLSAGFHVYSHI